VVLIALDGDTGKASGRSVEAFDLLAGLTACGEHLVRYGGHRAAAGLEIERGRVADFASAFAAYAERVLRPQDLMAMERVDAVVAVEELDMTLAEELRSVAPFGRGNPPISLMLADATFTDVRPMGEGKHARFSVQSSGGRARAVAFNCGGRLPGANDRSPDRLQATFALEVNEWNGVSEPRLVLRRAQMIEEPPPAPPDAEFVRAKVARGSAAERPPDAEAELEELVLFAL
jgi:single-stranded-DNA-specific exonuclease